MPTELEPWNDPDAEHSDRAVEAFDIRARCLLRKSALEEHAPILLRRSQLNIDGEKTWARGAGWMAQRAAWYGRVCGVEHAYDWTQLPRPDTKAGRQMTLDAGSFCEDGGGVWFWEQWRAALHDEMVEVATLAIRARASDRWTRAMAKELNRCWHAMEGEMTMAVKMKEAFAALPQKGGKYESG